MCKSSIIVSFGNPANSINSSTDPMQTISSKSSDAHNGIGLPQYLFLEKHQSTAFSSHY